jgi:ribosomal protein L11 methyltransferase
MALPYFGYFFTVNPKNPWDEILLAELQSLPFESFEMTEEGLNAFVKESDHYDGFLNTVGLLQNSNVKIAYSREYIEPENWNTKWEEAFNPITVDEDCVVRADFHPSFNAKYEIVINPKMSFGTGHHETTFMMLRFARALDFKAKEVLDMGCGTGILAILASMRGAVIVDAIDNDPWCIENSLENAERNQCTNINVALGDTVPTQKKYDAIFANINRNVLLEQLPAYAACLNKKGILMLSGFYDEDLPVLIEQIEMLGLSLVEHQQEEKWCALSCSK